MILGVLVYITKLTTQVCPCSYSLSEVLFTPFRIDWVQKETLFPTGYNLTFKSTGDVFWRLDTGLSETTTVDGLAAAQMFFDVLGKFMSILGGIFFIIQL